LQWITTQEQQNKHFEIEHSIDGIHFNRLGKIAGNGTISTDRQYQFVHTVPTKAVNYYRLKQVDNDGNFVYSKTVSLDWSQHAAIVVSIFPNPVKNILHVQHSVKNLQQAVIRTTDGKIVKQLTVTDATLDIPVQDLSAGNYVLYLYGKSEQAIKAFVK